jgi:hypothetical protein
MSSWMLMLLSVASSSVSAEVATSPLAAFAGSQVFVQSDLSLNTLAPGLQLSPNPSAETALFFLPRFTFGEDWQLRGRLSLSVEWTNSDVTTTVREPVLSDTTLQLYYRGLPTLFGIKALVGPQVVLPSSDLSQTRTMRFSPGIVAQLSRAVPLPAGSLLLLSNLSYQRPIYGYTTPGLDQAPSYGPRCRGDLSSCVEQASGLANARDLLGWSVVILGQFGDFAPALTFSASHQLPFGFTPVPGTVNVEDPSTVRVVTAFSAFVDWSFNDWGTLEVGYNLTRSALGDDGKYGNPFFDRYQDGRLYLGLNVALDPFLVGGAEGGVVRQ